MDRLPNDNARGKRRCGTGPNPFRVAMMACGMNYTATAEYLDAPLDLVQEWSGTGAAPAWAMREMQALYSRIVDGDFDLPQGAEIMQRLLWAWGRA